MSPSSSATTAVVTTTAPTVSVAISPTAVSESSASSLTYTFTRSGETRNALTVNIDLAGTAGSSDYTIGPAAWTKLLGTSGNSLAYALTSGIDGSIYVSGTSFDALDGQSNSGGWDAFLTKYSADGTKVWTKLLGSSGADYARALTTGLDGSVYVSGYTNGALDGQTSSGSGANGFLTDAFLTKYSADGTKAWTQLLGTSNDDGARALTTGLDDSIYVSGYTNGALDGQTSNSGAIGGSYYGFLTKYFTYGTKAWTEMSSGAEYPKALTSGLDGSIYVSGDTYDALDGQSNSGESDVFLTKYSSDGTKAWTKLMGSSGYDGAFALTTGLDGSIYVSGYTGGALDGQTNSGGYDAFLTKYSSDGTKAWTTLLGTSSDDVACALTAGLDGSIYVSGYTNGALDGQSNSGNADAFLTKYSADGTKAWTKLLGSSGTDQAFALTTGLDDSIYVSGPTSGALDGQSIGGSFVTKFQASPPITFAAGSSTATLVLTPTSDRVLEGDETVVVTVLAGTGYALGPTFSAVGSVDETLPTVSTFSPADEDSGVGVTSNIVLTFSESVVARGGGTIELMTDYGSGHQSVEVFSVSDATRVTISGNVVTIDPTSALLPSTGYHLGFDSALTDSAGNAFRYPHGQYNFTTAAGNTADITAYSWKAHTLLDGVAVGIGSASQSTGSLGSTSFAAITDTAITLTATRTVPTEEVASTSAAVNLQDAIAILKMIVGLPVNGSNQALSPYQALAADYDGNGTVQLSDAIGVLKHVVGLSAPDPTWYFVNEIDTSVTGKTDLNPGIPQTTLTADLSGLSPVHVGLVGYLSGDVDGSFAGASGASDLDVTQPDYIAALVGLHAELSLAQFGM